MATLGKRPRTAIAENICNACGYCTDDVHDNTPHCDWEVNHEIDCWVNKNHRDRAVVTGFPCGHYCHQTCVIGTASYKCVLCGEPEDTDENITHWCEGMLKVTMDLEAEFSNRLGRENVQNLCQDLAAAEKFASWVRAIDEMVRKLPFIRCYLSKHTDRRLYTLVTDLINDNNPTEPPCLAMDPAAVAVATSAILPLFLQLHAERAKDVLECARTAEVVRIAAFLGVQPVYFYNSTMDPEVTFLCIKGKSLVDECVLDGFMYCLENMKPYPEVPDENVAAAMRMLVENHGLHAPIEDTWAAKLLRSKLGPKAAGLLLAYLDPHSSQIKYAMQRMFVRIGQEQMEVVLAAAKAEKVRARLSALKCNQQVLEKVAQAQAKTS